jgi:hypothetical protein
VNIFYDLIYPICVIMALFSLACFPIALYSLSLTIKIVRDLLTAAFTGMFRMCAGKVHGEVMCEPWGYGALAPALAMFVVIFFTIPAAIHHHEHLSVVDGAYAKVIAVKRNFSPKGAHKTIYEATVDLGYGKKAEAILVRGCGEDKPIPGTIVMVATTDGITFTDGIKGRKISPTLAAWL